MANVASKMTSSQPRFSKLREYALDTDLHGWKRVVEANHRIEAIFCLVAVIVSISLAFVFFGFISHGVLYKERQVTTTITIDRNKTMSYPIVAICAQSHFRNESISKLGIIMV